MTPPPEPVHLFDREADFDVSSHQLPHWSQAGTVTFLTCRLADSLPASTLQRWHRERGEWLQRRGHLGSDWKVVRASLDARTRIEFDREFRRKRERELDRCHGECWLRNSSIADLVMQSLLYFDGDRYWMGDIVIMPNHFHCLVAFREASCIRRQCYSWLHFTATQINRRLGRRGAFWQEEPFDHLVRSESQLRYLRNYIKDNPVRAGLGVGEFLYRPSSRSF